VTPNTRGKPLGWASDVDWSETVKVLEQYGGVTNPLAASELYTNEFVRLARTSFLRRRPDRPDQGDA